MLSTPANAFVARATATGTILNDDPPTPPTGSYQGRTDQGYDIGFDVAPDLSNVNTLNFGLTQFCQPEFGKGFYDKNEIIGFLVPVPIQQPRLDRRFDALRLLLQRRDAQRPHQRHSRARRKRHGAVRGRRREPAG